MVALSPYSSLVLQSLVFLSSVLQSELGPVSWWLFLASTSGQVALSFAVTWLRDLPCPEEVTLQKDSSQSFSAPSSPLSQNCLSWRTVLIEEWPRRWILKPSACVSQWQAAELSQLASWALLGAAGAIYDPRDLRRSKRLNQIPVAHLATEGQKQFLWRLYKPGVFILLGISPFTFPWAIFWEPLGPFYLQRVSFAYTVSHRSLEEQDKAVKTFILRTILTRMRVWGETELNMAFPDPYSTNTIFPSSSGRAGGVKQAGFVSVWCGGS